MTLTPRLALFLTLPPLLWAANAVLGRHLVADNGPLTLNALRWGLAALILLPLGWRALRQPALIRQRWGYLLVSGMLGVGLYNALQYLALVSSSPLNVTLVASSLPTWMLAVGSLFYGQHPTRRQIAGALLGLGGVLLIIGRGSWATLAQVRFVAGDLIMLAAIIGWAFYSWLLARPPAHMQGSQRPGPEQGWDWAGLLLLQVLFGLLPAAGFALGEQWARPDAVLTWTPGLPWAAVFLALGPSIVAYRCWGLGVAQAGPAVAAFFGNLTPLFAAVMSALALGEMPQPYHAGAFALIVAGIAISSRGMASSR